MTGLVLKINGKYYAGWKSVAVTQDMQSVAHTFQMSITNSQVVRGRIAEGDSCEILIDDAPVIAGYIDAIAISYDSKQFTIQIEGRSKTGDLVDCSIPAKKLKGVQFNDQTFLQLCQALAGKFGIDVVDLVGGWLPLKKAVIEQGQPVFEFLELLARSQAVLLQSNAAGDLVITRAASERISTALILGENILSASAKRDITKRFSHYYFTAQTWGDDNQNGAAVAHITGHAEDQNIRYRPTVFQAENVTNLQQLKARAAWQRNVSYGRSRPITYTVNSWHHGSGVWAINKEVKVIDEWLGVDGWLLIIKVVMTLDDEGERTEITVMPKVAFDGVAIPVTTGVWP